MARVEIMRAPQVQELANVGQEVPPIFICKEEDGPSPFSIDSNIPIIDMSVILSPPKPSSPSWKDARNQEKSKLKAALQDWGLFQAVGHGISEDLMGSMRRAAKGFFELPLQEKMKVGQGHEGDQKKWVEGYGHDPVQSPDQILDWCDMLYLQTFPENHINLQFWPHKPCDFGAIMYEMRLKVKEFADNTLRVLAEIIRLEDDCFTNHFDDEATMHARFNPIRQGPRPQSPL
ncbi:hypothetical protein AMTRI_Chr13g123690 [Amborella trichopoda]